jgi:hypothetical protein
MPSPRRHVCFTPESGHQSQQPAHPLGAKTRTDGRATRVASTLPMAEAIYLRGSPHPAASGEQPINLVSSGLSDGRVQRVPQVDSFPAWLADVNLFLNH